MKVKLFIILELHDEFDKEPEFDKIKGLKGVDDEVQKFLERIKETVENLMKVIIA